MAEISSVELQCICLFVFSKPTLVGLRQRCNNSQRVNSLLKKSVEHMESLFSAHFANWRLPSVRMG